MEGTRVFPLALHLILLLNQSSSFSIKENSFFADNVAFGIILTTRLHQPQSKEFVDVHLHFPQYLTALCLIYSRPCQVTLFVLQL